MTETPPFPADDADPWTIPLHGIPVPLPADAVPTTPAAASDDALPLHLLADDVPSDVGYHPRLRRSA